MTAGCRSVVSRATAACAATDLARDQPSPAGLAWDASGGALFSGMLGPILLAQAASSAPAPIAIAQATGALAWIPSPVPDWPGSTPVTVDRQGPVTPLPGPDLSCVMPSRLSPDGRELLVGFSRGAELAPGVEVRPAAVVC